MGIQWCGTSEWLEGKFAEAVPLYGGQLPVDRGASVHIKIERPTYLDEAKLVQATTCRVVMMWTLEFRGRKGVTDITVGPSMSSAEPIMLKKNIGLPMDPSALCDLN